MISRPLVLLLAGGLVAGGAAWASRADSPAASSSAADTTSGAALFRAKGCAVCHDGPDSSSGFDAGPSLADAATWAAARVPGLSADEYLAQSILDPGAVISPAAPSADVRMPAIAMGPGEVDALVAHLLGR